MASYAETTSVQIRRGNHAENLAFCGVIGEVSADLGVRGDGTDIETTLRLHNGITAGGIALARADATNIGTAGLAENRGYLGDKNLAYADLSNLETLTNTTAINRVVNTLHSYGLATSEEATGAIENKANINMSNVNTASLAEATPGAYGSHTGKNLAYFDMSNVNTKYLANNSYRTGTDNDNALAYADSSNVDTTYLTTSIADRPETMTGPVLAKNDLSNVTEEAIESILETFSLETTNNKINELTDESTSNVAYPSAGAVVNYVNSKVSGGQSNNFLNTNFSNASDWTALYTDTDITTKNVFKMDLESGGTGYTLGYHPTSISCGITMPLSLLINAVDSNNVPTSVTIIPTFGYEDFGEDTSLTFVTENNDTVTIKMISNNHDYCYEYTNEILNSSVTHGGFSTGNIYSCNIITSVTPYNSIDIKTIDENGTILTYEQAPWNYASEYAIDMTVDILHLLNETGENALMKVKTVNVVPSIGGAGLLKKDLSNLKGMTYTDINSVENHDLYINPDANLPSLADTIPNREYGHIVTVGKLMEAMNNSWSGNTRVTYRIWS